MQDKFQRILSLQSRLGDTEIIQPGRELLKEGELLKISRKGTNARYMVLLSDCLLYCCYTGSLGLGGASLRVSYNIPLDQLALRPGSGRDSETEFSITSSVRSCVLRARNLHERNEWLESVGSAIEEHRSKRASFLPGGAGRGEAVGPSPELGDTAPVWVPDGQVTMCQECCALFSLVTRRHHCRACGRVLCGGCLESRAPLRYQQFSPGRVCDTCYTTLLAQLGDQPDLRAKFRAREGLNTNTVATSSQPGQPEPAMAGYLTVRPGEIYQ